MKIQVTVEVPDVCDDGKLKCEYSRDAELEDGDFYHTCDLYHRETVDLLPCPACLAARERARKGALNG